MQMSCHFPEQKNLAAATMALVATGKPGPWCFSCPRNYLPGGTFLERFLAGSTAAVMAAGGFDAVFADAALDATVLGAALGETALGAAAFEAALGGLTAAAALPPEALADAPFSAAGFNVAYSSLACSQCSLSLPVG